MQPRLKTSKKWTSFPKEYTAQIKTVFEENFEADRDGQAITVEGRIYPGEVLLRVGLAQPGRLRQSNFEVSLEYNAKNKDALERIHNAVDAVASMMADYFEDEEKADLPLAWQEFPFQGKTVFLQFSTVNSDLEKQADALLGIKDEDLVVDAEEHDEDALARAESDPSLTVDPNDADLEDESDETSEEEEAPAQPKMFSGAKNKAPKKNH